LIFPSGSDKTAFFDSPNGGFYAQFFPRFMDEKVQESKVDFPFLPFSILLISAI
jgi:hypothetical protein